jgi:hypothetical protein
MDLESINSVLASEHASQLILQSFDVRGRELVLAFACDGGPREDEAFVVYFQQAALFHVPSVLYQPVRFRLAAGDERAAVVPSVSYDPLEFGEAGKALKVVLLTDAAGQRFGCYIAAESVSASWAARSACLKVW